MWGRDFGQTINCIDNYHEIRSALRYPALPDMKEYKLDSIVISLQVSINFHDWNTNFVYFFPKVSKEHSVFLSEMKKSDFISSVRGAMLYTAPMGLHAGLGYGLQDYHLCKASHLLMSLTSKPVISHAADLIKLLTPFRANSFQNCKVLSDQKIIICIIWNILHLWKQYT